MQSINGSAYSRCAKDIPPKGGRVDLSDEEVTLAVEYMVEQLQ
jgi:cytochrome c5